MKRLFLIIFPALIALSSCVDKNPIRGTWTLTENGEYAATLKIDDSSVVYYEDDMMDGLEFSAPIKSASLRKVEFTVDEEFPGVIERNPVDGSLYFVIEGIMNGKDFEKRVDPRDRQPDNS